MPSKIRDIAEILGVTETSNTTNAVLTSTADGSGGVTVYSTKEDLPSSGLTAGDQAYVTANSRFYISNGSGWYNVALVNATPALTIDPTGAITLSTTGDATTITLTATDSDNAVTGLTYSVESDGSFGGLASLSQDSSVFTITPLSEDSATTTSAVLTFKASDGISFGTGSRTLTLSFKVQYSNYTTMLVKADTAGTDNQVDASTNAHTITEYYDATSTAFTPYHPGGYAIQYDAISDYITAASSADFDIGGTGDWSLEGWVWWDPSYSSYNYTRFMGFGPYYNDSKSFGIQLEDADNSGYLAVYWNDGSLGRKLISSQTVAKGEWVHIAVCRQSNAIALFYNGTRVAYNGSYTASINTGNTNFWVGHDLWGSSNEGFIGYHADIRVINGSSAYDPTSSSITVPTGPLETIANTVFHTGTLPYIADKSSSSHTITTNGAPVKKRFGPYDYQGYSKADHGGSVRFDGTSDYLSVAADASLNITQSSDVTLEAWIYLPAAPSANKSIMTTRPVGAANEGFDVRLTSASKIQYYETGAGDAGTTTTTIPVKVWTHVAVVKTSGNVYIYINGKLDLTATSYSGGTDGSNPLFIGRTGGGGTDYINAYIADARVVKGTAVYTSDFTPPTSPLTAVTNTSLLTCTNKNDIWDVGNGGLLKKGGNAAASNTTREFTTSSAMAFDGAGDYVLVDNGDEIADFKDGDFTIELWMNMNTPIEVQTPIGWRSSGGATNTNWLLQYNFYTSGLEFWASNGSAYIVNGFGDQTLSAGQWYHVAVTRNGSTFTMWIDGSSVATATSSDTIASTSRPLYIGYDPGGGANAMDGYLQDVRITKGLARYTTSFTPPTAEFDG